MKKRILSMLLTISMIFSVIGFNSVGVKADTVISKGSWFESMYAEWNGSADKTYDVYYKESSASDYVKADQELVREVKTGKYRVDVLGLKGDTSYDVKVVDSDNTVFEFTDTTMSYDRSGFAFSGKETPGAYKADGTPEDNALIIYVTESNKNSVYNKKKLTDVIKNPNSLNGGNPVIIRIIGKVNKIGSTYLTTMSNASCGVTIEGVGVGSGLYGWGITSSGGEDIEFRNLNFRDYIEDALGFQNLDTLWVHNNTFYSGYNPNDNDPERDKIHGDGSCDIKRSDNITVSYNHFNESDKTSLIGSSASSRETTGDMTFHHNFFESTGQRTPRVRWHNIHVYNNYYLDTKVYGIGATCNSSIFAENNFFENAASPMLTSSQGGYATKFSDNDGGVIKAYNNKFVNTREFIEGVDYFNAPSREYRMTASDFTTKKGGYTYNNFDANGYIADKAYKLDTPDGAKENVLKYAGTINDSGIDDIDEMAAPKVSGNVLAVYYYDPDISGSTGESYGGLNGVGNYFTGSGTCANNSCTGYRGIDEYSYEGSFSSSNTISFTTENPAKFTIICSTSGSTPLRMELKNSENPDAVYHGMMQSGNKGEDVLTTINCLEAGTYSFKADPDIDIYYIEVAEYNGDEPVTDSTTEITTEASTETTTESSTETSTETTTEYSTEITTNDQTESTTESSTNYLVGDIDLDGSVSRIDLVALGKYFAGYAYDLLLDVADINSDGKINRNDLVEFSKYFAGFDIDLNK